MRFASELLARLLSAVDGRALAREQWLRAGWPRAALVFVLAIPLLVAGPLRFATGISLGLAFLLATLLSILALAPFVRAFTTSGLSRRRELIVTAAAAAVAVFAAALPYNYHFHGIANYLAVDGYMGVDGGYHLSNYFAFVRRTPTIYGGFVSLYSFWDALRLGPRHLLLPLNIGFMFTRVVAALAPCLVSATVLYRYRDRARAYYLGGAACVVATLAVQYAIVLPLETFHQMGGFWSHLFGLVPLMALWIADVLVRQRLLRLLALLGAVALYRYTYGLNLGDLIAAVAALVALETLARALPPWVRALLAGAVVVGYYAARYCFLLTVPLHYDWGWIVTHDVVAACGGQRLVLASFALTLLFWPARATTAGSGIVRALRFPLVFGLANLYFIHRIQALPTGTFYYFAKYDFHAVVLVACGAVVVVSYWVAVFAARPHPATAAGLVAVVALAALGLVQVRRAFEPYQEGFREQALGAAVYRRSQAWVLPAAVTRMQQTLDREHKSFGGYLSKRLPMFIFTNSLFDHAETSWLRGRTLSATPGTCVFWDADRYPEWDAVDKKQCYTYVQQPWGRYTVCGACY
jgi:hypothetical protein